MPSVACVQSRLLIIKWWGVYYITRLTRSGFSLGGPNDEAANPAWAPQHFLLPCVVVYVITRKVINKRIWPSIGRTLMRSEGEDVAHALLLLCTLLRILRCDASGQRFTEMPPFPFHSAHKLHKYMINATLYPNLRITVKTELELIWA